MPLTQHEHTHAVTHEHAHIHVEQERSARSGYSVTQLLRNDGVGVQTAYRNTSAEMASDFSRL